MCPHHLASIGGDETVFGQRLGPNDLKNKGPRIFPMDDLGGLIKDLRRNKLLDLVTILRQWNNQDNGNNWETHHGKGRGGNMQANGGFFGVIKMPKGPDPYFPPIINGTIYQTLQGKVLQAPNP